MLLCQNRSKKASKDAVWSHCKKKITSYNWVSNVHTLSVHLENEDYLTTELVINVFKKC